MGYKIVELHFPNTMYNFYSENISPPNAVKKSLGLWDTKPKSTSSFTSKKSWRIEFWNPPNKVSNPPEKEYLELKEKLKDP